MDIRSPLNQCIALSLAGILFLNPIVAAAAGLALDKAAGGNTGLSQAGNGVPVVNIATPNGAGLSNNYFRDYNVGANGLILNNATGKTQGTQLGGIILGNPNLKGQAAQVILNQVTGGNRSTLAGYTEVAGQSARVIVANPHGITCQGCGFINTPRATLTTGKPIMDGQRLERFQVDGGDIVVEGAELNVGNLEQFDLITRSAKLNAKLYAKNLNIVTGRNDVQADSLQATPRAADGSEKPQLAIDSSALGGMYAGAIRLVGTEQGVGVKLAGDMAASGGDIRIDASGKLSLAQASSQGDLKIAAQAVELNGKTYAGGSAEIRSAEELVNRQSLAARERIALEAAHIDNAGVIEAGVEPDERRNARGDLELRSGTLRNAGSLVASRALEAKASQALDNQGGSLKGGDRPGRRRTPGQPWRQAARRGRTAGRGEQPGQPPGRPVAEPGPRRGQDPWRSRQPWRPGDRPERSGGRRGDARQRPARPARQPAVHPRQRPGAGQPGGRRSLRQARRGPRR